MKVRGVGAIHHKKLAIGHCERIVSMLLMGPMSQQSDLLKECIYPINAQQDTTLSQRPMIAETSFLAMMSIFPETHMTTHDTI